MFRAPYVLLLSASLLVAGESPAPPQPLWLEVEPAKPQRSADDPMGQRFFLEPGVQFDLLIGFPIELRISAKLGDRPLWLEGGVGGFVVPFFGSALVLPYAFAGVRTDLTLLGENHNRLLIRPGVGIGAVGSVGDFGGFGLVRGDIDFVWDYRSRRGSGAFFGAKLGIALLGNRFFFPLPIVGILGGLHF